MVKLQKPVVSEEEFLRRYNQRIERRGSKDVLFIWIVLMFISVVAAHFALNVAVPSTTGYVTAGTDAVENINILMDSFFVLFIAVFVGLLAYIGISKSR
jgi:hypothetical protein